MEETSQTFPLRKTDLRLFKELETPFRELLSLPTLSAEDIVGLARAIRLLERLPRCSDGIDVSINLDFRGKNLVSNMIVRLSSDQLSAERSAASRLSDEYEFESFPSFDLTISSDGDYEREGDKQDFFENFTASLAEIKGNESYSLSIIDESTGTELPTLDEDDSNENDTDDGQRM